MSAQGQCDQSRLRRPSVPLGQPPEDQRVTAYSISNLVTNFTFSES